jgi:hypothetical protein
MITAAGDALVSGAVWDASLYYPCYWLVHGATITAQALATGGTSHNVPYPVSGAPYMTGVIAAPSGSAFPAWFVGYYKNGTSPAACYWKDATTLMPLGDYGNGSTAYGIATDGSKYYIAGSAFDGTRDRPCYWYWSAAGGSPAFSALSTYGPTDSGYAFGISVSGGVPYIAGTINNTAGYWSDSGHTQLNGLGYNPASSTGIYVAP